jgi:hypothetical protein
LFLNIDMTGTLDRFGVLQMNSIGILAIQIMDTLMEMLLLLLQRKILQLLQALLEFMLLICYILVQMDQQYTTRRLLRQLRIT